MFAILGGLFGLIQSLLPEGLKYLQDRRDKAHELQIMKLQMDMQAKGASDHLDEIRIGAQQAEVAALQASYRAEIKYSGKYSASVRPTVTYLAVGLYVLQKVLLIASVLFFPLPWHQKAELTSIAIVVWTAFDETILSYIVVFWFGDRQLQRRSG